MTTHSNVGTWAYQNNINKLKGSDLKKALSPRYILSFLILSITAGITIGREILSTLHLDTDYLTITLVAIVVAFLTAHRQILLVTLVVGVSCAVNLPQELLLEYGLSKNILRGTLLAIICEPILGKFI